VNGDLGAENTNLDVSDVLDVLDVLNVLNVLDICQSQVRR